MTFLLIVITKPSAFFLLQNLSNYSYILCIVKLRILVYVHGRNLFNFLLSFFELLNLGKELILLQAQYFLIYKFFMLAYSSLLSKVPIKKWELMTHVSQNRVREILHSQMNQKSTCTLFDIPNLQDYYCCQCDILHFK